MEKFPTDRRRLPQSEPFEGTTRTVMFLLGVEVQSNEQRNGKRRSAATHGLGVKQANRRALERRSGKGATPRDDEVRSGQMAGNKHALSGRTAMELASYEIIGSAGEWRVSHDGKAKNVYQTKGSAFEAAVAAASLALRQGYEVRIAALGHGTTTGAANSG
jgi:hypothetical protein